MPLSILYLLSLTQKIGRGNWQGLVSGVFSGVTSSQACCGGILDAGVVVYWQANLRELAHGECAVFQTVLTRFHQFRQELPSFAPLDAGSCCDSF